MPKSSRCLIPSRRNVCVAALAACFFAFQVHAYEINPEATIFDSPTTLMGINHIGLSVRDLDAALEFYQSVADFKLVRRETIANNSAANRLFGHENVDYEIAVLEAPNMLFELIEFSHNRNQPFSKMPVQGPGMTHTCFQSPAAKSGYDKFKSIGAEVLSRGEGPVDLLGRGVTYAYVYDPEGNMIELEQLDFERLGGDPRNPEWIEQGLDLWMTQVALVTHDIERLTDYYAEIMAFSPYREADIADRVRFDDVTDVDDVILKASWFRMNARSKTIEFWQYDNPVTKPLSGNRSSTDLGYSYSIEVGDIQIEYRRMRNLGVNFVSEPVLLGDFWQVYANDIDGNVFSLRQALDINSPYSVPQLEQ